MAKARTMGLASPALPFGSSGAVDLVVRASTILPTTSATERPPSAQASHAAVRQLIPPATRSCSLAPSGTTAPLYSTPVSKALRGSFLGEMAQLRRNRLHAVAESRHDCATVRLLVMQVFVETDRLVLRRFTEADVDSLFDLDSDPGVMRFLTGGKPTPRDAIQNETLPRFLNYYERFAGFGFWAAIEKTTGEFVGWFEFRPREGAESDEVELGYRLRRSAWGKGYATEGSRALIRKGFTELGVQRVVAQTMAVNIASRRVMEKAGLTLEQTFHRSWAEPIEGAEYGEVEYALRKADWKRRDASGFLCTSGEHGTST